jgi:hypothetical protein
MSGLLLLARTTPPKGRGVSIIALSVCGYAKCEALSATDEAEP